MLNILNTKQIKALDQYTIQHEPISSIDLMERACREFVNWFTLHLENDKKIGVVCGTGNNGGDGLGIARMLKEWGYPVKVWIVRGLVPDSEDFKINLNRLNNKVEIHEIIANTDRELFTDCDIIIDAIFGSGLSRPPEGIYAQAIQCINQATALKIAVDVPSGLMADGPSPGDIVKAHYTITFQLPKLAFLFPQSYTFTGEWIVVDIGLNDQFISQAETPYHYVRIQDAASILLSRSKFDHKGTYGHALLIAGSYGKMGAAVLAARATLRAGVGLLTVHVPKTGYDIIQSAVPEAMASVDADEYVFTAPPDIKNYSAIAIGPGLGRDSKSIKAIERILSDFGKPMVLDADVLNTLSIERELMHLIPQNSILTPHPKEFERLVGTWKNDFDRLDKQVKLAVRLKSIIVLKGAHTSVARPDGHVFFNSTGNPGMATGGTGDVLTGIITGLLAQQYEPCDAAILGVLLHGLSGDIAIRERGEDSLIASDLIEYLPQAFLKLARKKN